MKRLLLFDIDGTLVRGGPAKEAFRDALLGTYGTTGPIEDWDFSGKTDPLIARELLGAVGMRDTAIDEGFPALWSGYLDGLEAGLRLRPMEPLPGVLALVDALRELANSGEVALGLVTGNLERGAELKLGSVGMRDPFPIGGYGSDHEERDELPGFALRRARERWRTGFAGTDVVVIGDTPRDIACGRAHGMRTVAVATGSFDVKTLEVAGADDVIEDLSETERVLHLLMTGGRAA